jgi:hypothetical protein
LQQQSSCKMHEIIKQCEKQPAFHGALQARDHASINLDTDVDHTILYRGQSKRDRSRKGHQTARSIVDGSFHIPPSPKLFLLSKCANGSENSHIPASSAFCSLSFPLKTHDRLPGCPLVSVHRPSIYWPLLRGRGEGLRTFAILTPV